MHMKLAINQKPRPFIKWAGGKTRVVNQILEFFPAEFDAYFEPFLGGGSLYFAIAPQKGNLNDMNHALISAYINIRDRCDALISELSRLQEEYYQLPTLETKQTYYYERRNEYNGLSLRSIRKSSLFIFLNKTCFNGMYRENTQGQYNIPFGKHMRPSICDVANLLAVSEVLKQINISCGSYELSLGNAKAGDFIYFDPPYAPINPTSKFTQYQAGGFTDKDQKKLRDLFRELSARGCYVMQSNSTAESIAELYSDFYINKITVARSINSTGTKRGKIEEVLITNYPPERGKYIEINDL